MHTPSSSSSPKTIPLIPTIEEETRAYCADLSRRLLEYEVDPRHFLKKMRASLKA